ncbi:acyl-CoA dehydrogenase family protein [Cohnella soli]|uniref:Acyl-CoA dehydrogenase family protein n=1 Tax=Cohnella soli TaxID=425005 RepID=A0ABW0I203_9BACL
MEGYMAGSKGYDIKSAIEELSNVFRQNASRYDQTGRFPHENFDLIIKNNLHTLTLDAEYGGLDLGFQEVSAMLASFASGCASTALSFAMHVFTTAALHRVLPDKLRESVLRDVQQNGQFFNSLNLANVAVPDPNMDYSNRTSITIEKTSSGYKINGFRKNVSGIDRFKYIPILGNQAGIDKSLYGITALLLTKGDLGVSVEHTWNLSGMKATKSDDIHFENVLVPFERLIGKEGHGIEVTQQEYHWSRLTICSVYLGLAKCILDHVSAMIMERKDSISKVRLAYMPGVQSRYAHLKIKYETANSLLQAYAAQADRERNKVFTHDLYEKALITKYYLSHVVNEMVWEAMQIEGMNALKNGSLLERIFRDARAATFHPPYDDLLTELLAKTSLGLITIKNRWV